MKCVDCGHLVANGGNRHAASRCPALKKPGENRRARKRARRAANNGGVGAQAPSRGTPVAGTSKVPAEAFKRLA